MQESNLDTTAATLEEVLFQTLDTSSTSTSSSTLTTSASSPPTSSSNSQSTPLQQDDDVGYKDGDLPEFSDHEQDQEQEQVIITPTGMNKLKTMKGPAGRKKTIPLSSIKQRITGGKKEQQRVEPPPPPPPPSTSTTSTTLNGKGKGKALKMTDQQLDQVITKFTLAKPELQGKISREEMLQMIELLQIDKDTLKGKKGLMGKGDKDTGGSHKFWKTQPVPQGDPNDVEELKEGPLEPDKKPDQVRKEPIDLHKDFEWCTIDLNDPLELKEVYELLTHHYVEDADASFRFDYQADFIEWALKPPGYVKDWHVGIRVQHSRKLVGFIAGIPVDLRIRTVTKRCTEINFLVVHKKLRSKRLAPLLIQEVTRRTHLKGIFQAIYTSGTILPTPFTRCQYYHRNLNPPKLVKLGFSAVPRNSTIARMSSYYRVPQETSLKGLREIEKRDLKQCSRLLRAYLARFDCAPMLSNKEVEHALWTGRGREEESGGKRKGQVVWTYVVEDPETHRITDLFSIYSLPSTAVKSTPLQAVNAGYLFYYATDCTPSTSDLGDGSTATKVINWKDETEIDRKLLKQRLTNLIGDAMICSQKLGFDVLNALTLQDNSLFLEDLKFGRGDGFLNFYLYNYHTKPIEGGIDSSAQGSGIGVVML